MNIFDSIKDTKWSGRGISLSKGNLVINRNAKFSQTLDVNIGEYSLKLIGKKRNGNGKIDVSIVSNDGITIFSRPFVFSKSSWTEFSANFSCDKNYENAELKVIRDHTVFGTMELGRVIISNNSDVILNNNPIVSEKYRPKSKRANKISKKVITQDVDISNHVIDTIKYNSKEKRKVAFIIPYGIYGGGEIYIRNLISKMDPEIFDISILYMKDNPLRVNIESRSIQHIILRGLNYLESVLIQNSYDYIVYYNRADIYQSLVELVGKNKIKSRLVEIYHSDFVWLGSLSKIRDRKNVDILFTISDKLANDITGVKNRVVLPVGIEVNRFKRKDSSIIKAELDIPMDKKYIIGTVARLSREKNLDYIIDLAKEMSDCSFVIAGEGNYRKNLEVKIRNLGVDNVHLIGFKKDIHKFYNLFDGFILSSKIEGVPISIVEAMASEVPVFSNMVGAISDAIEDGVTGFKIYEDVKLDSEIIRQNIKNTEVIKNAKEYVLNNHNIEKNSETFSRTLISINNIFVKNKDAKKNIIKGVFI